MKTCICSLSLSMMINSVTNGYFKVWTALQKGDPLSPPLFVLILNFLSYMLDIASVDKIFLYHPRGKDLGLTHFAFTDDSLILTAWTELSLAGVMTSLIAISKVVRSGYKYLKDLYVWFGYLSFNGSKHAKQISSQTWVTPSQIFGCPSMC